MMLYFAIMQMDCIYSNSPVSFHETGEKLPSRKNTAPSENENGRKEHPAIFVFSGILPIDMSRYRRLAGFGVSRYFDSKCYVRTNPGQLEATWQPSLWLSLLRISSWRESWRLTFAARYVCWLLWMISPFQGVAVAPWRHLRQAAASELPRSCARYRGQTRCQPLGSSQPLELLPHLRDPVGAARPVRSLRRLRLLR